MYKILPWLLGCIILVISTVVQAQTPYYNQFHLLPTLNNPAAPSLSSDIQVNLGYRSTNVGSGAGTLNTPVFGLVYPIFQKNARDTNRIGYAGLTVLSDRTGSNGLVNTTGAMASFGYNLKLASSKKLAVGMHLGYFSRVLDQTKYRTGSQWNPATSVFDNTLPSLETGVTTDNRKYPLLNLGIMYFEEDETYDNNYYIGISGQNLNRPITSFYGATSADKLPVNYMFTAGTVINKNNPIFFSPNLRYIFVNKGVNQLNIGGTINYRLKGDYNTFGHGHVGFGVWYSQNNAVITSIEINQPDFSIGFSYDWFTNQLNKSPSQARTTELVLTLKKYLGPKRPAPAYFANRIVEQPPVKKVEPVKPLPTKPVAVDTTPKPIEPEVIAKPAETPVVEPKQPKPDSAEVKAPIKKEPIVAKTKPVRPKSKGLRAKEKAAKAKAKQTAKARRQSQAKIEKRRQAAVKASEAKTAAKAETLAKAQEKTEKRKLAAKLAAEAKAASKAEAQAKVQEKRERRRKAAASAAKAIAEAKDKVKAEREAKAEKARLIAAEKQAERLARIAEKNKSGITDPEVSYIEDTVQPHYKFNNAKLKPEAVKELDSLISLLNKYPELKLEVQGHSCNIGTRADNITLSRKRAESAITYLLQNGIPKNRLVMKVYGETRPKVPNDTEENRVINRRVQFRVLE